SRRRARGDCRYLRFGRGTAGVVRVRAPIVRSRARSDTRAAAGILSIPRATGDRGALRSDSRRTLGIRLRRRAAHGREAAHQIESAVVSVTAGSVSGYGETKMKRACLLAASLALAATFPRAAAPTITIDASTPAGKVSPLLYGLMTEEINHAYDGGLYAELIRNRAFLDAGAAPAHWSAVHGDGAAAAIALDPGQLLNAAIPTSVRLDVTQAAAGHRAGIANEGYWGIPVRPKTRYRASFFAKA